MNKHSYNSFVYNFQLDGESENIISKTQEYYESQNPKQIFNKGECRKTSAKAGLMSPQSSLLALQSKIKAVEPLHDCTS